MNYKLNNEAKKRDTSSTTQQAKPQEFNEKEWKFRELIGGS